MINAIKPLVDSNNPGAMIRLAKSYKYGRGVIQDYDKAIRYYQKAISLGHTYATIDYIETLLMTNRKDL